MNVNKEMRTRKLKTAVSRDKWIKLKTIVEGLKSKKCDIAQFELGYEDSEFTAEELQAFAEYCGFGLYGFSKNGKIVKASIIEKEQGKVKMHL